MDTTSLEDRRLGEEVVRRFKEAQKVVVTQDKRSRTVHASNLTGPCILQTWYSFRNDPEPLSAQSIANFYVGQILHKNAKLGKKNEVHYSANIRTRTQPVSFTHWINRLSSVPLLNFFLLFINLNLGNMVKSSSVIAVFSSIKNPLGAHPNLNLLGAFLVSPGFSLPLG